MKFFIFSGTAEQARNLARAMDLAKNEWDFVHSSKALMGTYQRTMLTYGTWENRADKEEVLDIAMLCKFTVLHIY
jgi:hypothetical protein